MSLTFKSPASRIFVALDVPDIDSARIITNELGASGCSFKIGMELFYGGGAPLVRELVDAGNLVFLDLKLHDIPNTVSGALRSLAGLGAQVVNLHASGGGQMMRAARKAADEAGIDALIAVTILTSLGDQDLKDLGFAHTTKGEVLQLARLANEAGLDGVVCSPREIRVLRDEIGDDFLLITPGIRPGWAAADDQKRIMTPAEAFELGTSAIVIGRPVTKADSPRDALKQIIDEIGTVAG